MAEKSEALFRHWSRETSLPLGMLAAFMDFVAKHGVPRCDTAFRILKRNGSPLTVSKRDHRSRLIAACYSYKAWLL